MKVITVFVGIFLLTGCVFGTSKDIKKAELLLNKFECNNVESSQIAHSSITAYHELTLYSSKQKASSYVQSYKDGEKLFDIPLNEVIEQQYSVYKSACEYLGGLTSSTP